jgi:hypothetical protein
VREEIKRYIIRSAVGSVRQGESIIGVFRDILMAFQHACSVRVAGVLKIAFEGGVEGVALPAGNIIARGRYGLTN